MDDVAPPDRPFDREVACSPDVGSVDDSFESASDESNNLRMAILLNICSMIFVSDKIMISVTVMPYATEYV